MLRAGIKLFLRAQLIALFVSGSAPVATAETASDTVRGEKLYLRYCRGCHGKDGRGGAHSFMPHIENLTKKGYIVDYGEVFTDFEMPSSFYTVPKSGVIRTVTKTGG